MKKTVFVVVALMPLFAVATEFNAVQPDKSRIAFVSKQMGVPIEGAFGRFDAKVAFDPARPEGGRAQIEVDLGSIDAGSKDATSEVKGKNWFDVARFPTASFVSTGVKPAAAGRYEAKGQMTIKGRARDVVVPFTFRTEAANAVLEGAIPIRRSQFGIGEGVWADTDTVADEVQVKFRFSVAAEKK